MNARPLCLLLLLASFGCASEPLLEEDGRVQALRSHEPLPYALGLARPRLGFDPERINRTARNRLSLPGDLDALAGRALEAVRSAGLFPRVEKLGGGTRDEVLARAAEKDLDFVVETVFDRWDTVYRGTNGWFPLNLFLWFQFLVPSWIVPDQDYAAEMGCTLTVRSVHTGKVLHQRRMRVEYEEALCDISRGFQLLGIFRAPDAFDREDWQGIADLLAPRAEHEWLVGFCTALSASFRQARASGRAAEVMRKRLGLVVGLSHYRDHRLPRALFARRDADAFAAFLADPRAGAVPERNLRVLVGERASRQAVLEALHDLARRRARPGDSLVVYFAGLGTLLDRPGAGREPCLLPFDARVENLRQGALGLDALLAELGTCPARVLLLLDTGFRPEGGTRSWPSPGAPEGPLPAPLPGNVIVARATTRGQACGTLEARRHGLFTHFLLQGLDGKADADEDDVLTLPEAFLYAKKNTEMQAFVEEGRPQNPLLEGRDPGGWVLGRGGARRPLAAR